MRMYRCPECNKLYPSMYCDLCQKSIPHSCATDAPGASGSDAATGTLEDIKRYEERSNYLLSEIERHARVMKIIMIVSAVCSALSAVITIGNVMRFF